MPFVQAKCENCEGILQVDSTKKAAICPYCGTPYVVQDAINNYITNIGNLHADVVNVNADTSAKARLDAAEAFMKLRKYGEARNAFSEVSSLTPQDYLGWWGQVRAITKEFTHRVESKSMLADIFSLYQSALVFVPNQEKQLIEQQFLSYYQPLVDYNAQQSNAIQNKIRLIESELAKIQATEKEWINQKYHPQVGYMSSGFSGLLAFIFLAGIVMAFIKGEILLFVLGGIPLSIGLIWEIIIRPIQNSIAISIQRRAEKKLQNLYAKKNSIEQELKKAQQQLDYLSK